MYNVLGYVYLEQKQYDKAKEAFDKYIAMEANRPNPYDSKGDYFMAIKAFDEANVSFMRAFAMDSLFVESKQKANYAVKMKKMEEQRPVIDSLTTSLLHYFANDMDMYYSHFAKDYRFRFIFNGKLNATFQQMVEYDKKNLSSCKSIRFNITNQNVDMIEEKLAVANQNFDFEIDTNDGGTFKSSGYWSLLWRYMNGQWKIVHAIETSKIPEE